MKYRPDIDGLRAVAVLSVVVYHAYILPIYGGYVGVDVFFVISGYLISTIILTNVENGTFSLAEFYERRIRRIFPALAVMLLFTTAIGYLLSFPPEYQDFGKSLVATILNISNIYFMLTTDYFAEGNSEKPLLHTWSLGVEEQFYLLFPLLVMMLANQATSVRNRVFTILAIASFVISVVGNYWFPVENFFSPLTRAWELLLGTLLASGVVAPQRGRLTNAVLGSIGLLLVGYSVIFFVPQTLFPGIGALAPVVGSALIIYAGMSSSGSPIGNLLSISPVVFLGKISYSLYLWHWPILKLLDRPIADLMTRIPYFQTASGGVLRLTLVVIAIAVATISWRYVETPFRKSVLLDRRKVFFGAFLVASMFIAQSAVIVLTGGVPSRYTDDVVKTAAFSSYKHPEYRENTCFITSRSKESDFNPLVCLDRSMNKPNYLLLGDSHAAHLYYGLTMQTDANILQVNASGCKPFLRQPLGRDSICRRQIEATFESTVWPNQIDGLILSARWKAEDLPRLIETVKAVISRGVPVTVVGPTVQYAYEVPYIIANSRVSNDASLPSRLELRNFRNVDREFAREFLRLNLHYGSIFDTFCKGQTCPLVADDGVPIQFDYSHLTSSGSEAVVAALMRGGAFDSLGPQGGKAP